MMKKILFLFIFSYTGLCAQNKIEWSPDYVLQLSDFQSSSSKVGGDNIYSLYTAAQTEFSFYMSNYEFMFTKNFNSKVNCTFTRNVASLIAPDTVTADKLLKFARYDFDLTELYARKFRSQLYEKKGAFSSVTFFKPIFEEIEKERVERYSQALGDTDMGKDEVKLQVLHAQVLREIGELADFCKTCKPAKKSKKKE